MVRTGHYFRWSRVEEPYKFLTVRLLFRPRHERQDWGMMECMTERGDMGCKTDQPRFRGRAIERGHFFCDR
jgi:hypothetical protein